MFASDIAAEGNQLLSAIWPGLLSWPADHFYPSIGGGPGFFTRVPLSQTVLLDDPFRADGTPFQNWVESLYAVGVIPMAAAASALFARRHRVQAWFTLGFVSQSAQDLSVAHAGYSGALRLADTLDAASREELVMLARAAGYEPVAVGVVIDELRGYSADNLNGLPSGAATRAVADDVSGLSEGRGGGAYIKHRHQPDGAPPRHQHAPQGGAVVDSLCLVGRPAVSW